MRTDAWIDVLLRPFVKPTCEPSGQRPSPRKARLPNEDGRQIRIAAVVTYLSSLSIGMRLGNHAAHLSWHSALVDRLRLVLFE